MSTVLRRLYNVAYGRVRIWREGASELDEPMEPVFRRTPEESSPGETPEAPEPLEPSEEPPAPTTPRQRRL